MVEKKRGYTKGGIELRIVKNFKLEKIARVGLYCILILYAVITLLPFLWTLSSSFKSYAEIVGKEFTFFPREFTLENYRYLFSSQPLFPKWVFNSFFIAISVTAINVFLNTMTGYVLARIEFKGKNLFFMIILAIMAVPAQILMIPSYIILSKLGLIDTYTAMILPSAVNAVYIFMMRQFFVNYSKSIEEAAMIDGLSKIKIFFKIVMPLAKSSLATQAIFVFMGSWNDFMKPLLYLNNPNKFTLPLGLKYFQTEFYSYWNYIMAASVISIVPILIMYIILNRYFMQGMNMSGDK
jgi:multiple sugar transport system permease protein